MFIGQIINTYAKLSTINLKYLFDYVTKEKVKTPGAMVGRYALYHDLKVVAIMHILKPPKSPLSGGLGFVLILNRRIYA